MTTRSSSQSAAQAAKKSKIKNLWKRLLQIAFIMLWMLLFYGIYLDGQVSQKFKLERYQAPALLYSQAYQVKPQAQISKARILEELQALDYRAAKYARQAGEYQDQGTQLLVHRRSYDYAGQYFPAERVLLLFSAEEKLIGIESWPEQKLQSSFTFEPHLLGRFSTAQGEDRLLIGLEQVPSLLIETLLLVEDRSFYHHHGVRPTAIIRAAFANLVAGRSVQGGSTLTQQLIKNMYLDAKKSYWRKVNEALMALSLDYRFSKDEILEAYLNEVYFGQDRGHAIHGIALASQFYFGKQVENLSVSEIAMLVGMIKGPSLYEPRKHAERAQTRRDLVLKLMFEHDLISQPQYLSAVESPVKTRSSARLTKFDRPDFIDLVRKELNSILVRTLPKESTDKDWQKTGLIIYTTFDPLEQKRLEQAARGSKAAQNFAGIERAMLLTDQHTGAVRALVGGEKPVYGGFNRAFEAYRPVGSLVKPWLYALAFEQAETYHLATQIEDSPLEIENERGELWQPQNFDRKFRGPVNLFESLIHSYNVPTVRLGQALGAKAVQQRLAQVPTYRKIHPWPSLFLGAVEMNLLEVATYYGGLANEGLGYIPYSIEGLTTHRGELLYQHEPEALQLFEPAASWMVGFALEGAVLEGTARAIAHLGPGLAGKTGSTNDLRDSWFASYDAQHVLISWMGQDSNDPIGLTGSRGALPLAAEYWNNAGVQVRAVQLLPNMYWAASDSATGKEVASHCEGAVFYPKKGSAPAIESLTCGSSSFGTAKETPKDEEKKEKRSWWQRLF